MARLMMYVDGFNLYHGLKAEYRHKMLWLDLVQLGRLLRPRSELVGVRYFTAPVLDDPDAESRQATYQHALSAAHPGLVEVVQGRYQRKTRRCRKCGSEWNVYEEKETDVNIAVRLVADSAAQVMDVALLVSADSDLVPAIHGARAVNPSLTMVAAFPPQRSSNEIKNLLPASFPIWRGRLARSLLPDVVNDHSSGRTYRRPDKWC